MAELYRPYGATIVLDRCYDLAVHHDKVTGVVVLEYASQGRVVVTGAAYSNRYISVLSIVDRKVAHWRDYLDPLAVFDAVGWPHREGSIFWLCKQRSCPANANPTVLSRTLTPQPFLRPNTRQRSTEARSRVRM